MAKLVVKLDGHLGEISATSFVRIIHYSLVILHDLDRRITEDRSGTLKWVLSELGGSQPYVELDSHIIRNDVSDESLRIVDEFTQGIHHIQSEHKTPAWFSNDNVASVSKMVSTMARNGVRKVEYSPASSPTTLTAEDGPELNRLVGAKYHALGSIEGRIEVVSLRRRSRRFNITEERTQRSIRCNLTDDLEERVFQAMAERQRVVVSGVIAYNAKNEPISVKVKPPVRFLRQQPNLPTAVDLLGRDPDFTGQLSTEEFVSALRDG